MAKIIVNKSDDHLPYLLLLSFQFCVNWATLQETDLSKIDNNTCTVVTAVKGDETL